MRLSPGALSSLCSPTGHLLSVVCDYETGMANRRERKEERDRARARERASEAAHTGERCPLNCCKQAHVKDAPAFSLRSQIDFRAESHATQEDHNKRGGPRRAWGWGNPEEC